MSPLTKFSLLCGLLAALGCGNPSDAPVSAPPRTNVEEPVQVGAGSGKQKAGDDTTAPTETRPAYALESVLRINEMQFKGSHNSYHVEPSGTTNPEFRYTMPPLAEQLDTHAVRAVELDLHYYGGKFYVYHLPVDDQETTCPRLVDCLAEMLGWSEANPGHHLLTVFFDFRDTWDTAKIIDHMDELDAAIRSVYPPEKLLVPDDVVGASPDIQSAIRQNGWPTLGATRGKTMFVMWAFGDAPYRYAHDGTGLSGRVMFVASTFKGWRHAMILGMDTSIEQEAAIRQAVLEGYFVRTRSDRLPGNGGDFVAMREAALRSGAQAVLTDYPAPGMRAGYEMNIPGGTPSRCNPVTARAECYALGIENPELLGY